MTSNDDTMTEMPDDLLTAYALGECTTDERLRIERLLASDSGSEARRTVEEARTLAAALKEVGVAPLPDRSATLRRAVLAATAQAAPVLPARRASGRTRLAWMLAGVGTAAALLLTWLPTARLEVGLRQVAQRDAGGDSLGNSLGDSLRASEAPARAPLATPSPARSAPLQPAGPPVGQPPVAPDASKRVDASEDEHLGITALMRENHTIGQVRDQESRSGTDFLEARRRTAATMGPPESLAMRCDARRVGEDRWFLKLGHGEQRERYATFADSRFLRSIDAPLSTFSIDVDTASYANVRRFLTAGQRPPRDAVRIEELVNYFRYADPPPEDGDPFSVTIEAAECPWRTGHRLVRIGLKGRDLARDRRPAGNLVFLVDVSGSMGDPDKLPLVKQALAMLVDELTENDRVAIVTYAGEAGLKLPPTSGDRKDLIRSAIESLSAGGSTHGSAGIELAYAQAAEHFIPGGANRVILATDGDLNVGVTDDAALVDLITAKARGGTFLTVLGFGQGNLQDEKMERLADTGNGVYAYIDGVREARKVLVEQLTGSTITIAKDVKIQVEFNPAVVESYRLIGYENRALANEDFRDDRKDAGEIGAGHGVTALYEVRLSGTTDGPGRGAEPLKYGRREPAPDRARPGDEAESRELLTVKLRFKQPEGDTSRLLEKSLSDPGTGFEAASEDLRFAAAVAAFGMLLRGGEHAGDANLELVARIAGRALGDDPGGYRTEFLDLVRRAESAH